jgi:phosphatidylglycerophosphate synthase
MANLLTAIRLLLVGPFAILMSRPDRRAAGLALLVWMAALATDFADGAIARRTGTLTPFGGTFDHASDFLFVTAGLFAGAHRGVFPWILPALITAAFAQYFIDSYWIHRHRKLRGSKLGRYNGILYFLPAALECAVRLGATLFNPALVLLVWALVASTVISMALRLRATRLPEHLPAGPA